MCEKEVSVLIKALCHESTQSAGMTPCTVNLSTKQEMNSQLQAHENSQSPLSNRPGGLHSQSRHFGVQKICTLGQSSNPKPSLKWLCYPTSWTKRKCNKTVGFMSSAWNALIHIYALSHSSLRFPKFGICVLHSITKYCEGKRINFAAKISCTYQFYHPLHREQEDPLL
jgi:hypothetical protein